MALPVLRWCFRGETRFSRMESMDSQLMRSTVINLCCVEFVELLFCGGQEYGAVDLVITFFGQSLYEEKRTAESSTTCATFPRAPPVWLVSQ